MATVNPYWRGNPMVRGRFFNRQHRFRPGMGSVLKWRLSPNPQRKEKKTVKWNPKVCYLRSLDAVVGDSLVWLGHNSFFLQLAGKRIMFDPVFHMVPPYILFVCPYRLPADGLHHLQIPQSLRHAKFRFLAGRLLKNPGSRTGSSPRPLPGARHQGPSPAPAVQRKDAQRAR